MYEKAGNPLHPITESLIKEHMINNAGVLPTMAGITQRLTTRQTGSDFAACHNCSGILSAPVNVVTGKVESAGSHFS
ncbi:hypothetical protein [Photorhabdus temperata]|uniref:Uncharacterized protein n=2 Tax=Photorhabdus temperata TaxID=574560 RepID=U7QWD7_PHOTE|nr:hypothetical protein [Photorhabdus temperata]ERT10746.1 hypothetical protein O185_23095 [Photorhabdus temperata J3]